jgi:hypothetical protein
MADTAAVAMAWAVATGANEVTVVMPGSMALAMIGIIIVAVGVMIGVITIMGTATDTTATKATWEADTVETGGVTEDILTDSTVSGDNSVIIMDTLEGKKL